jgi:membrane-associated phospholipid phosphatase
VQIYAVFDLGLIGYWAVPTAPPWFAAEQGALGTRKPSVRRLMREHGQAVWKGAWDPLYDVLGGNPLAAMPSLHFATSVMAAHVLGDAGAVQGTLGWAYAGTLGFALVYLGEHYAVDLLAGLALAEAVRRQGPRAAPALRAVAAALQRLEARAHA